MSVIYYDFETTGIPTTSEILCIGAVTEKGEEFKKYVIPRVSFIHPNGTNIHGLSVSGGVLYLNAQEVEDATEPEEALEAFITWLREQNCKFLVAHNNLKYDKHIFQNQGMKFGVEVPNDVIHKDSLVFAKDSKLRLPKISHILLIIKYQFVSDFPELRKRSLDKCLDYFLGESQPKPHDALIDAKYVKKFCDVAAKRLGFENHAKMVKENKPKNG